MCQGTVDVVGRVSETVSERQRAGCPWLWGARLYPGCGALSIPLCDPPAVFVACQGHRRGVRGTFQDR